MVHIESAPSKGHRRSQAGRARPATSGSVSAVADIATIHHQVAAV